MPAHGSPIIRAGALLKHATTLFAICCLAVTAGPHAATPDRAVLDHYCVGCHNARIQSGGLDLANLDIARAPSRADVWEKVVRKLRTGAMPPQGAPRPDEATYDALASSLERSLDAAAASPGAPSVHRLNRAEYGNAVRDLLDLEIDPTALLPPDDIGAGF